MSTKLKTYELRWEIQLDAKSPRQAANLARKIQLDPTNMATHFSVYSKEGQLIDGFEALHQQNPVKRLIADLRSTMAMMQDDPDMECVDTISVMEDTISDLLYYFTGERHRTRDKQEQTCPDCGRGNPGEQWPSPCPSDDCPSHRPDSLSNEDDDAT